MPTPEELLRIQVDQLTERGAMLDFIDVGGLSDLLGADRSLASLNLLNELYEPSGQLTRISTFSQTVFETPRDFDENVLHSYMDLRPPYNRWLHVEKTCCQLGAKLADIELSGKIVGFESRSLPKITELKKPHASNATLNFNRSTAGPSLHAIENIISRGGTKEWMSLYQEAFDNPALKAMIAQRLPLVDMELAPGARKLWAALMQKLPERREMSTSRVSLSLLSHPMLDRQERSDRTL